jgi:hypothetical protein
MRLYLDTEFTESHPEAKLISIALVDENGDSFYAELTDTYKFEQCSSFVKLYVIPFLKNTHKMTFSECALALGNWIEDREEQCVIVSDNPGWDMPYLKALLNAGVWPANLLEYPIRISICDPVKEDIILDNDFDIHNALDDAKVMMLADRKNEAEEY